MQMLATPAAPNCLAMSREGERLFAGLGEPSAREKNGKILVWDRIQGIVLLVINALNQDGAGPLSPPAAGADAPPPYLDVNGDNQLSPVDALLVISALNERAARAEGESAPAESMAGAGPQRRNSLPGWPFGPR